MRPPGPACVEGGQWLADVDDADERLPQARALCAGCPALASWCRPLVLEQVNVDGVAAAMTLTERLAWRERHGVRVEDVTLIDVTPVWDITPAIADALPVTTSGELHSSVLTVIKRMTAEGMSSEVISERLAHPHVSPETVDYVRRTYMRAYARVEN